MPHPIADLIAQANDNGRWKTSADFHRALKDVGVDVTYQTARNWWRGMTVPDREHGAPLAALLGVDRIVVYEATAGGS